MPQPPTILIALCFTLVAHQSAITDPPATTEALQKLADGYRFTEGPAVDEHGDVWFTDIPNSIILRYRMQTGEAEVAHHDTGGANGLMFDAQQRLLACQGKARRLVRYEADGSLTVLADEYQGQRLNSPNDLDIDAKGGIYFTDPRYGSRDDMEMNVEGVYYLNPEGQLLRVIDDLVRPNGLILSRDGNVLYVADEAAQTIMAYEVQHDGTLANGRVFAKLDPEQRGGADGMTLDEHGNVYAACPQGIVIWNVAGERLLTIPMPVRPTNCAFAGPDGRDLYITARDALYRIRMNLRGRD